MSVRDFMRGEMSGIKEATIITKHGRPIGTWVPFGAEWSTPPLTSAAVVKDHTRYTDKTSSR